MNLLKDTVDTLIKNDKKDSDIKWVGSKDGKFSWKKFKLLADTNVNPIFGSPQVAENLLIVGKNWWLERHEHDGSEWWEYKELPNEPINKMDVKALTVDQATDLGYLVACGWERLEVMNGEEAI